MRETSRLRSMQRGSIVLIVVATLLNELHYVIPRRDDVNGATQVREEQNLDAIMDKTTFHLSSSNIALYLATEGGMIRVEPIEGNEEGLSGYDAALSKHIKEGGRALRGYQGIMPTEEACKQNPHDQKAWCKVGTSSGTYSMVAGSQRVTWQKKVKKPTESASCSTSTTAQATYRVGEPEMVEWQQSYKTQKCESYVSTSDEIIPIMSSNDHSTSEIVAAVKAHRKKTCAGYRSQCRGGQDDSKPFCASGDGVGTCKKPADGWRVGDIISAEWTPPYGGGYLYVKRVTTTGSCVYEEHAVKCAVKQSVPTARIRPLYTVDPAALLFVSASANTATGGSSTLSTKQSRFVNTTDASNADGYKLYLNDSAMNLNGATETSDAAKVQSQVGNNIYIFKGTDKINLQTSSAGTGDSAPTHLAAAATATSKKGGAEMFGELATMSAGSSVNAELDLTNLMDVNTPGESVSIDLYAEQENGVKTTSYMSAPYTLNVTVVDDQVLALTSGQTLSGEYGDELTLTAGVNENVAAPDCKWDAEKELTASIADGYTDIAEVKSSTWDGATGKTTIVLTPKKSGKIKLKLHKDDNKDKGFYVGTNDVITEEITIETRKVKLTPKAQTHKKLELYSDFEIQTARASPGKTGDAFATGDSLPDTVKVKVSGTADGQIPTRTLSGNKRLSTTGTWTQEIDKTVYDANPTLNEKYTFSTATSAYTVNEALTPGDTHITVTPACTYPTDTKCWHNGDVTIKPSDTATGAGYTQIKNTTKSADQIETSEEGFGSSITITEEKTNLDDIKYNLKDATKNALTNQGAVKNVRIDKTAPASIDVKVTNTPVVAALEASLKAVVEAAGGNAGGIRFDKVPLQIEIAATDDGSGIREIKAYQVDDGNTTTQLSLSEDKASYVANPTVSGPGSTADGTTTYSKKVYKVTVGANYRGRIKVVATDNAGNESTKMTNKIVHEDTAKAGEMILTAGSSASGNGDGTYKIPSSQLNGSADIKWPLKFQASHSGIRKISYYITNEDGSKNLKGTKAAPVDATTDAGITVLNGNLSWDNAADDLLDTSVHDNVNVVSLRDAIEQVKDEDKAVVKVHAILESNAGNVKEETFTIQALYQKIDWSESIKRNNTSKDPAVVEVEATYGTPLTLSAEMVDEANRWSADGDFSFTIEPADSSKVKLRNLQHESLTTKNNASGTAKGKATIELVPLIGDNNIVTITAKKDGKNDFMESNTITLQVKLKSKPITVTAKSGNLYDVRTGEKHPKLEYTITDAAKNENDAALVKDTTAGIDDTGTDKKVDFLLKATTCATGATCGITDLSTYTQETTRINDTGEWKLEFQHDKSLKDTSAVGVFNQKYDITFIDYKTAGNTDKTLKVTQDAFAADWYTITDPKDLVKTDPDAWNNSAITVSTTAAAKKDKRTYSTITNDVKIGTVSDPVNWQWATTFTHTKDNNTDAKTYQLCFRDPTTGAFTAAAPAKRSVRVDEDDPSAISFHSEVKKDVSSVLALAADIVDALNGNADGIRFANQATVLTINAEDTRSGIRDVKAYMLNADGTNGAELSLSYQAKDSTEATSIKGPSSTQDDGKTYSKKVYTVELNSTFNSKIRIVATDNAGNQAKKTTNQIVLEKSEAADMVLEPGAKAPKNAANQLTVNNAYVNGATETLWPLKIKAPHSGIKKITYYITEDTDKVLDRSDADPYDVTGSGKFGIEVLPNAAAWTTVSDKTLDTAVHDEAVVSLKSAVNQMKGKANAVIRVHAKLESNAGNVKDETFDIHISNQEITWSDSVKAADTNKKDDAVTLETTFGTPIDISAEMVQESTGWSATSNFTYSLKTGDETKANITAKNTTHASLTTSGNTKGTAKGKAGITLIPLTGDDEIVTLNVKKESDNEYAESNTLTLTVKLKSKKIDVTADPTRTYDVKTGEKHPKLTWKITGEDGKEAGALVKDDDVKIDDTTKDKAIDFLLKATDCLDSECKISTLKGYAQDNDRINEVGEWKLEFQYDKNNKTGDTKEQIFNRRYAITFIDHKTADKGTDKTLKVTQDSFTNDWYTITPEPDAEVKDDKHAWNTGTVTIQPTDKAVASDTKKRTYKTLINDDLETVNAPDTWGWGNSFTHTKDYTHDTEKGTDAKTYKLRFRDPDTGAFTAQADARRSVRVDKSAPIKPFISVNKAEIPADTAVADSGTVQGKRFSKDGLNITVSMIDEESGMRSFKIYTVDKDGNAADVTASATITDTDSTVVPGVTDGAMAVRKKTGSFTISTEFKGTIRIVGMNNAGQTTTYESNQIINEPETANKLEIGKDETDSSKIPEKITRDNYDKAYIYPWKIAAPVSGIKQIKYTMQVDDNEETVTTLLKKDGDITSGLAIETVEDKAVHKDTGVKTPTYTVDQTSGTYSTYFTIGDYVDKMIEQKAELGTIKIKIELLSNAGNTLIKTFELPVDLMLNDPENYLVVPKQVRLYKVKGKDIAQGSDKVELKTVTDKPAGLDITQYFNVYTDPEITLHKLEDESGRKHTFTVSVHDENNKTLTSDKNLLTSLNYPGKLKADFTLTTPLVKDPEKDKDRGEYRGLMEYKVKYGKQDTEKQPAVEVKP